MKKIFAFVLVLCSLVFRAQLDTEHWFAPMGSNYPSNSNNNFQAVYLSTPEPSPFDVQIYNHNILVATVTLSKDHPAIYEIPRNLIITESAEEKMTVSTKGLHLVGPKRFFANLRFSVRNHAEFVTSKGIAALGTSFFAAMPKLSPGNSNYMLGIIATEDQTTIQLSGYDQQLVFVNEQTLPATTTITLNRGQSYIFEANNDKGNNASTNGLIGVKITSNKPISLTNGVFSGQITSRGFDIFMDQSVPTNRVGTEYVIVNGNAALPSEMEKTLVIATEDQTEVYLNGQTTPFTVLNEGEFAFIGSEHYLLPSGSSSLYNLYVRSTKNIVVYQILAGSSEIPEASGGFNFIPQLSCFLPNTIDQLGNIDENRSYSTGGLNQTHTTKMNIIAQKGAKVSLFQNNALRTDGFGPYPVEGTDVWETYTYLNVSGNITVKADKPVTAGIVGGSQNVGYGGFFAGFSSVPVITKTGDCYHGVLLQVDDSYDNYQWYKDDILLSGENRYFLRPEDYGSGIYSVRITKYGCDSKTTEAYVYTSCSPITEAHYNQGTCNSLEFLPVFSASAQSPVPEKTKIIVAPRYGIVSLGSNGSILYTPDENLSADTTDTFVYSIEGNGSPADSEFFRVFVHLKTLAAKAAALNACENADGKAIFDLTSAEVTSDTSASIAYYTDQTATQAIGNPSAYPSPSGTVYARITSTLGCSVTVPVQLTAYPMPQVDTSGFDGSICDDDFDGKATVRFSDITPSIVPNANAFQVNYYDALNPSVKLDDLFEFSKPTEIIVEVISPNGCPPAQTQFALTLKERIPLKNVEPITLCDNNRSGQIHIRLGDYVENFHDHLLPTFYASLDHAQKKINPIPEDQTLTGNQSFFLRFESNDYCPQIGVLSFILKQPNPSSSLKNTTICPQSLTSLDAGDGFDAYLWSNGSTEPVLHNVPVGNYYVDLFSNGCVFRQYVDVLPAETPKISHVDVDGQSVTLHPQGGTPPYLFSINGKDWSETPVFHQVQRGTHTAFLKDTNNCLIAEKEFIILNLINVITPNGDGKNDRLDYADLKIKKDVSIQIFDRFGKLIAQIKNNPLYWDGTSAGRPVPTDTYWYLIQWTEPETLEQKKFSGWVLVKNR
ncbi:T9SS type B sorting domain-containing protein [Bergeyella sp. RCAD1439]|uniref:T9SS type B sorting domain-containing protein n=1 Tax=Bergeyella anatis TaxID=3113737 RepID=UPI002E16EF08|nr:T9SS type B sorting domain-containing protein [Bergeyella sp. RCAD1439]